MNPISLLQKVTLRVHIKENNYNINLRDEKLRPTSHLIYGEALENRV